MHASLLPSLDYHTDCISFLTKIYHCILKNVGEKSNLKEANNMYKKCTGKEPEYAMDIIEYFPELAEAADRYLDGVERALSARR